MHWFIDARLSKASIDEMMSIMPQLRRRSRESNYKKKYQNLMKWGIFCQKIRQA